MLSRTLFVALAGTAAATYSPQQLNQVRNLQADNAAVVPRQDGGSSDGPGLECTASALQLLSALPTPTSDLVEYLQTYFATATPTDAAVLCEVTSSLPTSLSSAYSSYDQAASSWYSEHLSDFSQLASDCVTGAGGSDIVGSVTEAIAGLESYTAADCTGDLPTGVAALTSLVPSITSLPNGTFGGGSPSTPIEQGAAARPTGVIAGAMAAAGFIGAVAML